MSKTDVVKQVVDAIVREDLEQALGLLAEDLAFTVLRPGCEPSSFEQSSGRSAMEEYFTGLGGTVCFWQVRYFEGNQVLVLGRERYTTTGGFESETDFALVCDVRDGLITRFMVVEDLTLVLGGLQAGRFVSRFAPKIPLRPTIYLPRREPASVRVPA